MYDFISDREQLRFFLVYWFRIFCSFDWIDLVLFDGLIDGISKTNTTKVQVNKFIWIIDKKHCNLALTSKLSTALRLDCKATRQIILTRHLSLLVSVEGLSSVNSTNWLSWRWLKLIDTALIGLFPTTEPNCNWKILLQTATNETNLLYYLKKIKKY